MIPASIEDYRELARRRLPRVLFDYIDGGSYAEVTLASRLMAAVDREVALDVAGVGRLEGRLTRVSAEWVMISAGSAEWVVALGAVAAAEVGTDRAVPEVAWSAVSRRLGLRLALRRLADSAEECVVHVRDGSRYQGTVARVGQDFFEVRTSASRTQLVSLAAVAGVQSWE